jgi:hypothetical protein
LGQINALLTPSLTLCASPATDSPYFQGRAAFPGMAGDVTGVCGNNLSSLALLGRKRQQIAGKIADKVSNSEFLL